MSMVFFTKSFSPLLCSQEPTTSTFFLLNDLFVFCIGWQDKIENLKVGEKVSGFDEILQAFFHQISRCFLSPS